MAVCYLLHPADEPVELRGLATGVQLELSLCALQATSQFTIPLMNAGSQLHLYRLFFWDKVSVPSRRKVYALTICAVRSHYFVLAAL
jgi:hypothetical protein